jgi:hypothetical protein
VFPRCVFFDEVFDRTGQDTGLFLTIHCQGREDQEGEVLEQHSFSVYRNMVMVRVSLFCGALIEVDEHHERA